MKPLKMGVLSVSSHYGLRLRLPLIASPKITLEAIASRSLAKAQKAAKQWGFNKAYGSYENLLTDSAIEAVYIPLPNHLHAPWIKKCLDAGKAVLCEKPLAMNAPEAKEVFHYAEKKGLLLMEAFMYRLHPQWQRAYELIQAGEIGDISAIHTIFSYHNNDKNNIRNNLEKGGGGMLDIGCYALSSARFLMGREPRKVISLIDRDSSDGTDILSSAILDFDGPRSLFSVSTRTVSQQNISVYGTKGSLSIPLPFNAFPDVPLKLLVDNGVGPREISCGPIDQYALLFEAFAQAFREGTAPFISPADSVANMAVIDALFRSEKNKQWENL